MDLSRFHKTIVDLLRIFIISRLHHVYTAYVYFDVRGMRLIEMRGHNIN